MFKSDFAILDVKAGRQALRARIESGEKVSVVIHGTITGVHSRDDGVSREFSIDVTSVKETGKANA